MGCSPARVLFTIRTEKAQDPSPHGHQLNIVPGASQTPHSVPHLPPHLNEGPSGCVILCLLWTAAAEAGSRWLHRDLPTRQLREWPCFRLLMLFSRKSGRHSFIQRVFVYLFIEHLLRARRYTRLWRYNGE